MCTSRLPGRGLDPGGSPDRAQKVLALADGFGRLQEELQDAELGRRQAEVAVAARAVHVRAFSEQVVVAALVALACVWRTRRRRREQARHQLVEVERLGQVIVRAGGKTGDAVGHRVARAQHEDRHRRTVTEAVGRG